MASEQENQTDPIEPQDESVSSDQQTPSVDPSANEMPVDAGELPAENDVMPGDAAAEPVESADQTDAPEAGVSTEPAGGAEPAVAAEAAPIADEHSEQPDGAVETVVDEETADELIGQTGDVSVDAGTLEAMLFSTHHPLTGGRLAELLDVPSTKPIRKAIRQLNEQYEQGGRCFRIEQVAGGFQMLTLPEYGQSLQLLHQREADSRLTKAALETLAIIAYKQPILRADVEAIRGVASGETIRSLMEKHLVKIAGRAEIPGRPILYGTTKRFLEVFGLNSLRDLPQAENLPKAGAKPAPAGEPAAAEAPAGQAEAPQAATLEAAAAETAAQAAVAEAETDTDEQAVNETVQVTEKVAEEEAVAAASLAESAAAEPEPAPGQEAEVPAPEASEPAAEQVEEGEPAEDLDSSDNGDEPRAE